MKNKKNKKTKKKKKNTHTQIFMNKTACLGLSI